MSSAICFNLDQSKILSSGNGLNCQAMLDNVLRHWSLSDTMFKYVFCSARKCICNGCHQSSDGN